MGFLETVLITQVYLAGLCKQPNMVYG